MRATVLALLALWQCYMVSAQTAPVKITVQTSESIHPITPAFWGTNFLYWIDDDASFSDGKLATAIKEANVKLLRYPGGTIADNFHWKTATLDNVNMFPYQSGEAETDFDEFMKVCKQTGAEPMCVLNTESWAVKNDITGGGHEAAEWLRYCKQKGYNVKYWEIGNETYWHPVLSADEYADLVNVYADSLKSIDPAIILGINGHWNVDFVGTKERIKKEALPQVLERRKNINTVKAHKQYEAFVKEQTQLPVTKGTDKWWQTLAEKCGDKVDMIIVHWYFAPQQIDIVPQKLQQLRQLLTSIHPDKKYLFNMSEFNVTTRTPESFMHLTEMMGILLQSGFNITSIWPMRMEYKKPTLLNYSTHQASIFNEIFRRLSAELTGNLVASKADGKVPVFASADKKITSVVMTGRHVQQSTPATIQLEGAGKSAATCSLWRIKGAEFDYQMKEQKVAVKNGSIHLEIEPAEVIIAVFNK
ncbi:hypothetical protein [Niabella ginsengisoli]|uniref:Alpha-L-arabinofuranosidase 1 catalytic domain-containing protein n=1 Tax=Niabella ginsengisoli TaxID=522298 RepID=A0ABS9SIS7_9BACT|nr:hypothetical protein [Niabella ginsengisoli]MCH5598241.1 hypothetical protein [Niabella ginsengisoli]